MKQNVYQSFKEAKASGRKKFAVLIDPDKVTPESLLQTVDLSVKAEVDYLFLGGSLLVNDTMGECLDVIKSSCDIPVIIFPGSAMQINSKADAIFLLSLISGRNADMLIGQHIIAAPALKESGLEILSTGYILVNGGAATTVSYISNTFPIPADKSDIAVCTAMAGEMLGLGLIYLDAGSGAQHPVRASMIRKVSENISVPLIVGGGITTPEKALENCKAGADIIVVGNAIEKDASLISRIASTVHSLELV